jgi:hypothetical protein
MRHNITILKAQENHWAAQPKESQVTSTCQDYDLNCFFFNEGSPCFRNSNRDNDKINPNLMVNTSKAVNQDQERASG